MDCVSYTVIKILFTVVPVRFTVPVPVLVRVMQSIMAQAPLRAVKSTILTNRNHNFLSLQEFVLAIRILIQKHLVFTLKNLQKYFLKLSTGNGILRLKVH
jgi:hypothetical protein